jgi:hypothetical protein
MVHRLQEATVSNLLIGRIISQKKGVIKTVSERALINQKSRIAGESISASDGRTTSRCSQQPKTAFVEVSVG